MNWSEITYFVQTGREEVCRKSLNLDRHEAIDETLALAVETLDVIQEDSDRFGGA